MRPIWPPQLFNHRPFSSTQDGISPLMVATANNRSHCVKILLAEGSVPNLKSNVSMYSSTYFEISIQMGVPLKYSSPDSI